MSAAGAGALQLRQNAEKVNTSAERWYTTPEKLRWQAGQFPIEAGHFPVSHVDFLSRCWFQTLFFFFTPI